MKNKKLETALYSTIGVAVMFGIIVAVNLIMGAFKARVDMTAEKLFSLSPGTKAILKKLDTPIEIRFYFSKSETRVPVPVRNYAQQVEDLLAEYKQYARGYIELKKFDPQPDTEAEESANSDGIEAQPLGGGDSFYFGVAISLDPQKVAIPALTLEREKLLEYDLSRAISRVMSTNKPVIGLMTSLPIWGMPMNPMMMRMGQQGQQPWVVLSELQRDFDVRRVEMDSDKIDDAIKVLLVIHPKDIKDTAQYAIDQFVMRGGRLIAFLDPMSFVDSQRNQQMPGVMPGGGSNLEKLLKAWGITFDTSKVVADLNFTRQLRMRDGRAQRMPTFLFVGPQGIDTNDVVTSQLDNLWLPFAGAFSGTPVTGLKETVLVKTTPRSQLVDGMMAQFAGEKTIEEFKESGTAYPLAIRLTGKFKTAFPDGKPESKSEDADKKDEKKDEKKEEKKPDATIKESTGENTVILVGDSDFITDEICVDINPIFRIATPRNGNLNLVQNMVEQMGGDSNLIGARSRASLKRPFTVVQEMQAQAQKRYQDEIKKLEEGLADAQKRLNELQSKKEGNQRFILSPEQQQELVKFKQKELETKKRLKLVRKDLRQDIDSLENRLKWFNIAGMPIVVSAAGIALAILRKQRTKAQ